MEYRLEDLERWVGEFKSVSENLINMAPTPEIKIKLQSILYTGSLNGFSFQTGLSNIDYPHTEVHRRLSMAYLLLRNPETFDYLVENNITVFHGSNGNSLPSILKYGLKSHVESAKSGIEVTTGEEWSRGNKKRDFISFSDVLDVSQQYAAMGSKKGTERVSFGVVYGTTRDAVNRKNVRVGSDVPEIAVKADIPLEQIKIICVPSDKVAYVKKIVPEGVKVLAMDDMGQKFFYMSSEGILFVNYEEMQKFDTLVRKRNFAEEELKYVAVKTSGEKIKEWFSKLDNLLFGGEEYERVRVK